MVTLNLDGSGFHCQCVRIASLLYGLKVETLDDTMYDRVKVMLIRRLNEVVYHSEFNGLLDIHDDISESP